MADRNNSVNEGNKDNPSTSQQNINNDTFDDANSIASSAGTLQMSLLENKLESKMANMSRTIKDTVTSLTEYMNSKLSEVDSKFNNLLADLVPTSRDSNVNSSVIQPPTEPAQNGLASGDPPIQCNSQQAIDRSQCKMKPQNFSGATDFDEFLSQFEITSEINGWQYREKSLYLASCLTGDGRSLLSELDHDGRRDYNTLIEKLTNRFGSVNRSEIYRTQLKSRSRNKGESIPELAQAIKKLVRQAYPGVNKDVIETLSIDNFIDALGDSDIRLRVRKIGPKTLADAERTALRLESHKIADRQRSRLVGQIESNSEKSNNAAQWESSSQFKILQSSIDSLSGQVEDLKKRNRLKEGNKMSLKAGNHTTIHILVQMVNLTDHIEIIPPLHIIYRGILVSSELLTPIKILTKINLYQTTEVIQMALFQEVDKLMADILLEITTGTYLLSLIITRETGIGRAGGPQPDVIEPARRDINKVYGRWLFCYWFYSW